MQIIRTADSISLNQAKYIRNLLERFNKQNIRPSNTPYSIGLKLRKSNSTASNKEINYFQQQIGSIIYASTKTRPDITYAINRLSQYTHNPSKIHWEELDKLWGYLNKYTNLGITLKKTPITDLFLKGYSDSDYANNLDNRRSTTGYLYLLGHYNLLSWNSCIQKTVALSTTEAEYMALKESSKEGIYLFYLIKSAINLLSLDMPKKVPIIFEDNKSSIKLAENPEFHKRTKHIDIIYHYIREKINNKEIDIFYIPTKEQLADSLTKPVQGKIFENFKEQLNIIPINNT